MAKRVLVTGGNGVIGRVLIDAWRASGHYDVVGMTRRPGPYGDVVGDLDDIEAVTAAFQGVDAVVHMAASSAVGSTWEEILPSNLVATHTVFEAAHRAGVAQVVFASSNHTVGTNENLYAPAMYELDHPLVLTETAELRPDSLYGVSKVYGEAMARYYVDHFGLKAACLRIGSVRDPEAPEHPRNLWQAARDGEDGIEAKRLRTRATWLSERDCVHLVERAIDAGLDWFVGYGISDNPRQFWDIQHARVAIGYAPQDSAPTELMPPR